MAADGRTGPFRSGGRDLCGYGDCGRHRVGAGPVAGTRTRDRDGREHRGPRDRTARCRTSSGVRAVAVGGTVPVRPRPAHRRRRRPVDEHRGGAVDRHPAEGPPPVGSARTARRVHTGGDSGSRWIRSTRVLQRRRTRIPDRHPRDREPGSRGRRRRDGLPVLGDQSTRRAAPVCRERTARRLCSPPRRHGAAYRVSEHPFLRPVDRCFDGCRGRAGVVVQQGAGLGHRRVPAGAVRRRDVRLLRRRLSGDLDTGDRPRLRCDQPWDVSCSADPERVRRRGVCGGIRVDGVDRAERPACAGLRPDAGANPHEHTLTLDEATPITHRSTLVPTVSARLALQPSA